MLHGVTQLSLVLISTCLFSLCCFCLGWRHGLVEDRQTSLLLELLVVLLRWFGRGERRVWHYGMLAVLGCCPSLPHLYPAGMRPHVRGAEGCTLLPQLPN